MLLNSIGVELVWFPINQDKSPSGSNFTTLNITQTTNTVATCDRGLTGITLMITKCSGTPGTLAVTDALSGTGITAGTVITGLVTGNGWRRHLRGQHLADCQNAARRSRRRPASLQSADFQTLSQQVKSTKTPPPSHPAPSLQMTIPQNANGNMCGSPISPLSADASTINMFFVSKLNPPASGGTLYRHQLDRQQRGRYRREHFFCAHSATGPSGHDRARAVA